jgi:soluble lytic murein transglycosylase-like protein
LGLTQITHSTARTVKPGIRRADLLEPEKNLRVGGLHLKHLLDEFKDPKLALAAYQAGTGRVKDVGHGILRHPHTGAHVSKVMHQYQEYKRQDAPSSQMTTSKTLSSKRSVATRVASNTKPATGPATRKNSSASGRIKSKNSQRA